MTEAGGLRTNATLAIYGDGLDPRAVSARLGLEPTRAFSREEMVRRRRQDFSTTTGVWLFGSREHVVSDDLGDHLRWLLDRLLPHAAVLQTMAAEGLEIQVRCTLIGKPLGGGPTLPAATLGDLASLGAPVVFDIYCP